MGVNNKTWEVSLNQIKYLKYMCYKGEVINNFQLNYTYEWCMAEWEAQRNPKD